VGDAREQGDKLKGCLEFSVVGLACLAMSIGGALFWWFV